MNKGLTRHLPVALATRKAACTLRTAPRRHPHAMVDGTRNPQRFPPRLARLLQIDTIASYAEQPAALNPTPLCTVTWRNSWYLSAKDRAYLTDTMGMSVHTQLEASEDQPTGSDPQLPTWSHVTWNATGQRCKAMFGLGSTVECAVHVNASWPLQAWSLPALDLALPFYSRVSTHDAKHLTQDIEMRAALLRVPQTANDNQNVALSSSEVNPDQDSAASGSAQLLLHPSGDTMGAYNPYGHFVGQLTLRRLHHLERRFLASQQPAQSSSTQSSRMPPGDVHDLLVAHGVQRAQPQGRPAQMRTRRWLPPDGVATAMRSGAV